MLNKIERPPNCDTLNYRVRLTDIPLYDSSTDIGEKT